MQFGCRLQKGILYVKICQAVQLCIPLSKYIIGEMIFFFFVKVAKHCNSAGIK